MNKGGRFFDRERKFPEAMVPRRLAWTSLIGGPMNHGICRWIKSHRPLDPFSIRGAHTVRHGGGPRPRVVVNHWSLLESWWVCLATPFFLPLARSLLPSFSRCVFFFFFFSFSFFFFFFFVARFKDAQVARTRCARPMEMKNDSPLWDRLIWTAYELDGASDLANFLSLLVNFRFIVEIKKKKKER